MCKDLGVKQCLVIGGSREPVGKFESSIQLLETGFFDGIIVFGDILGARESAKIAQESYLGLLCGCFGAIKSLSLIHI